MCKSHGDLLMPQVTNLYTNRALAYHQLDRQNWVLNDTNYVLNNIDPNNAKALYRRAHSYEKKGEIDLAVKDLKHFIKVSGYEVSSIDYDYAWDKLDELRK